MNKWEGIGRLTKDPEVRYTQGDNATCVARFNLAVDRKYKHNDEQSADFISCVAFGKIGEFIEKYFRKGMKVAVCGRLQTGSYTDRDGKKIYTTDIIVEEAEFAESKNSGSGSKENSNGSSAPAPDKDGFMNIPDGIDEELPFN